MDLNMAIHKLRNNPEAQALLSAKAKAEIIGIGEKVLKHQQAVNLKNEAKKLELTDKDTVDTADNFIDINLMPPKEAEDEPKPMEI